MLHHVWLPANNQSHQGVQVVAANNNWGV